MDISRSDAPGHTAPAPESSIIMSPRVSGLPLLGSPGFPPLPID
jgi:hypothetical protein